MEVKVEGYSPPPMQFPNSVKRMAKTPDNNGTGVSQQLVNTHPTTIQHPDPVGQAQNGCNLDYIGDTASNKIIQHFSVEKGEREGTKSSPPNGVLQNPVQIEQVEGEAEISSSPSPCQSSTSSEPVVNDRETFKIGDRVVDSPTGFKGVVVGFRGDRVVFYTYELGRRSRPASWLTKLN